MAHGIGRTKGGRNTKLHAVCDTKGRPLVLLLTPGNVHDCKVAQRCIEAVPSAAELVADKGYDSDPLRNAVRRGGGKPVIPSRKGHRRRRYDREKYKLRNIVERFFNRIKHFRRVATRYDKTDRNYQGFVCLATLTVTEI